MKPLTGHQTNTPSAEAIRAAARELRKIGRAQRDAGVKRQVVAAPGVKAEART